MNINQLADYIIYRTSEQGSGLNLLKLQKLAYYCQAWHLAVHRERLVDEPFQAWVHGPVSRTLYDRFRPTHMLYAMVGPDCITPGFDPDSLHVEKRSFVNSVLDAYAGFSGSQLEDIAHAEPPWQLARVGYGPQDLCTRAIDENVMGDFYRRRMLPQG